MQRGVGKVDLVFAEVGVEVRGEALLADQVPEVVVSDLLLALGDDMESDENQNRRKDVRRVGGDADISHHKGVENPRDDVLHLRLVQTLLIGRERV